MTETEPAAVQPRTVVDAFRADDPLAYDELPPDQVALRALMAVLAETGATVRFPVGLMPPSLALAIPSGWRIECTVKAEEETRLLEDPAARGMLLSARWVDRVSPLLGALPGGPSGG